MCDPKNGWKNMGKQKKKIEDNDSVAREKSGGNWSQRQPNNGYK